MPSEVLYACTHVIKEIAEDVYEQGCSFQRTCVLQEPCHLVAPRLPELLASLRERYGLALDDCFLPDDGPEVASFGYNRLENEDGTEPTSAQL